MEIWKEIFTNKIPKGVYQMQMINGEQQGLLIELFNQHTIVEIKFGVAQAVRMMDEGIAQGNLYSSSEIMKYKKNNFENVIYEVLDGEFGKQVNELSGGYGEILNLRHYVIITQNYNVDIIAEKEPAIEVTCSDKGA